MTVRTDRSRTPRRLLVACAVAGLELSLVGCTDDGGTPSSSGSSTPATPRTSSSAATPRTSSSPGGRAGSTSPSSALDVQVDAAPGTRLALAGLPRGAPPRVPWVERSTLHVGDRTVPLPARRGRPGDDELVSVLPWRKGTVTSRWSGLRLVFADASGRVTRVSRGEGLAASPDGSEVAWWNTGFGDAVVASAASGRELQRIEGPRSREPLTPVGWLGARDVLFSWSSRTGRDRGWRTSGEPASWPARRLVAASESAQLVAGTFLDSSEPDASCTAMFRAAEPDSPLWRHCYWRGDLRHDSSRIEFSPDGRLVLASGARPTGGARPYLAVLDARTGAVLTRFDEGRYGSDRVGAMQNVRGSAFEDDRHFLVVVADRAGLRGRWTRDAILRCAVAGGCELATRPVRYNWAQDPAGILYRLGR